MYEIDDEEPRLSPSTFAILQEFLKEKYQQDLSTRHISNDDQIPNNLFDENWQLSQFWYDEKTVEALVTGALNSTQANEKIALISCPTLYSKLKKECDEKQITLFEYDERFKVFGEDFIHYDYNSPLNVPKYMAEQFDLVIADPPFLSAECLTKTALTIKFLTKKNIVLCTGAVMSDLAEKLLNIKKCDFIPKHRNNLANEFCCFSNFDFDKALK